MEPVNLIPGMMGGFAGVKAKYGRDKNILKEEIQGGVFQVSRSVGSMEAVLGKFWWGLRLQVLRAGQLLN